jgi:hypothetical protein
LLIDECKKTTYNLVKELGKGEENEAAFHEAAVP